MNATEKKELAKFITEETENAIARVREQYPTYPTKEINHEDLSASEKKKVERAKKLTVELEGLKNELRQAGIDFRENAFGEYRLLQNDRHPVIKGNREKRDTKIEEIRKIQREAKINLFAYDDAEAHELIDKFTKALENI